MALQGVEQTILRDPALLYVFIFQSIQEKQELTKCPSYWILFPISIVMVNSPSTLNQPTNLINKQILTGILRHYATVLMNTPPKPPSSLAESRERLSLFRGVNLRNHACAVLPKESFEMRKNYLVNAYQTGAFLKDPESSGQPPPNPMTDPAGMDAMMGMMKGNMMMMIPQTLIMSWINAFFSGFVICMFQVALIN